MQRKICAPKERCPLNSAGHVATHPKHGCVFNGKPHSFKKLRLFSKAKVAPNSQSESCVFISNDRIPPRAAFLQQTNRCVPTLSEDCVF